MNTCASKVALSKSVDHIRLFHALVIPPVVLVAKVLNAIKSLQLILGVVTPHSYHNFAKEFESFRCQFIEMETFYFSSSDFTLRKLIPRATDILHTPISLNRDRFNVLSLQICQSRINDHGKFN